jgi:MOSC domain-containing protein YiiM
MLEIGGVLLRIHGEVAPCQVMDAAHAGLRRALGPEMRAGFWGRVLVGGTVRVGDVVRVRD